ncbi:uncharacterized protein EDB91DRAFT_52889 [Suillus paluster]|uniref:uncharacterized protein n=1 Tax=Suillus paluster TaxID=48578 RepID=UPI001B86706D|nr:uncharacterized protein EDB91DRAFT_52889 [Suillus paluster]KAG1747984.1 hypothetical protein EDB91DRAFT_52889 [Suillus paluster]
MSEQEAVAALHWNNNISVATITLICYEYFLLLDKEVMYVWKRPWSLMSCLYLIVRYFGLFLALLWGCWGGLLYMPQSVSYDLVVLMEWGFSVYFCFAEVILIWRLYALYNRSKLLLYVLLGLFIPIVVVLVWANIFLYSRPSAFSVIEIITPDAKYCTLSFKMGPMPAIYTSIPIVCYEIFLLVLAAAKLVKHLKDRKKLNARPNAYVLAIVHHHFVYFFLNLLNQIFLVVLWDHVSTPAMSLSELFNDTVPFILTPRLIISIWDTHAHDKCVYVSTKFEDCRCLTSPREFERHEMGTRVV